MVAAAPAAATLWLLFRYAAALPCAQPGPRSLHTAPVPRVGGLSIWVGAALVAVLGGAAVPGLAISWAVALAAVAAVSLLDDFRGVHPGPRVLVHLGAAAVVAAGLVGDIEGISVGYRIVTFAALTFGIAWAANLYNFMDGADGLAGAMAVIGFALYAVAASRRGVDPLPYVAVAAAALPLLVVNLPPARMFMGDVGAVPLGFAAASFGLGGWRAEIWPGWFPLLVFLPFVADATVTLLIRLRRRERLWEAHKFHYYQRLHQLGAGHKGTLAVFGVLMAGTGLSAWITLVANPALGWTVTVVWCGVLLALFSGIDYYWQRRRHRCP